MPEIIINYLAVLVAAIASMVVGFLWYGPLFGKQWMALSGYSEKNMKDMKMNPTTSYLFAFITSLVMAYVLAHTFFFANAFFGGDRFLNGLMNGFWIWLGFFATTGLSMVLWDNKPFKLYLLHTAHHLVALLVMSTIIATL